MRRGVPLLARMVTGVLRPKYPIPGTDLAGTVEDVGSTVKSFAVGDRVFAASDTQFSAHAEFIALPGDAAIAKVPSNMEFAEFSGAFEVIFDTVGKSSFSESRQALAAGGVYLSPVLSAGLLFQMLRTARLGGRKVIFAATGLRSAEEKRKDLQWLRELAEQGELRSVIDLRYPLAQAADAARYVDEGHKRGNVVLIMDPAYEGS